MLSPFKMLELLDKQRGPVLVAAPSRAESFSVDACPTCGRRFDFYTNPRRPGGCERCCETVT